MIRSPLGISSKRLQSMHKMKRPSLFCITTAAAFVSGSQAWVLPMTSKTDIFGRGISSASYGHCPRAFPSPVRFHDLAAHHQRRDTTTRLFSTQKDEGFLSKVGKSVKSFLPTRWFGSEEEKQKLARKKEYRDQVSGGLDTMLKDAPLGMRMMGKMISPLMSSMASSLADTMAEQQRTVEGLMDDANSYLMGDPSVTSLLGEPISVGAPFSQSSSTSSINGKTQSRVEMALPVSGPRGSGTVRLLATQDGISQMELDAGGRRVDVNLSKRRSSFGSSSASGVINADDNIIEAEVIDKKPK